MPTRLSPSARKMLCSTQPAEHFVRPLRAPDADARLFAFCAQHLGDKPGIADALAKNPACPTPIVARAATHLTSAGIQALLDNLERFTSDATCGRRLRLARRQRRTARTARRTAKGRRSRTDRAR